MLDTKVTLHGLLPVAVTVAIVDGRDIQSAERVALRCPCESVDAL